MDKGTGGSRESGSEEHKSDSLSVLRHAHKHPVELFFSAVLNISPSPPHLPQQPLSRHHLLLPFPRLSRPFPALHTHTDTQTKPTQLTCKAAAALLPPRWPPAAWRCRQKR